MKPSPPRQVRIVGGAWRGRKLPVPDAPGLRPTPDRVRETLFNWLGQDLAGWQVLDAFAGSGALGFEAASRGARRVTMIERDPALAAGLRAQAQRLGAAAVEVVRGDAVAWMASAARATFDLILLDPPFGAGRSGAAVDAAVPLLAPRGWLYLEAAEPLAVAPASLRGHRRLRAGAVHVQLWQLD